MLRTPTQETVMATAVDMPTRHALPDPGESVPRLSWPIVAIFSTALGLFAASAWLALDHRVSRLVTVALGAAVIFVMFTVLHDASHYSISTTRWLNKAF